jgi:DNA repair protein SbcD/Mre11
MPLTLLHTSDWHLGAFLADRPRLSEHSAFLDWLIARIQALKVDALLVTGDVFDHANPPTEARALFYGFLGRLYAQTRATAVITAGNHDSGPMLEAPRPLLEPLRVRVFGSWSDPSEHVVPVADREGRVQALVLAMPFLRGCDLPPSAPAEDFAAREKVLAKGVAERWRQVMEAARALQNSLHAPAALVALGHLFAVGAHNSGDERSFQVGLQLGVPTTVFPPGLAAILLGHLHRPQLLPGPEPNVWMSYSGAPVPIGFSEIDHEQRLTLLKVEDGQVVDREELIVPRFRSLSSIEGSFMELRSAVAALPSPEGALVPGWVSATLAEGVASGDQGREIAEILETRGWSLVQLLRKRSASGPALVSEADDPRSLDELAPEEVFRAMHLRLVRAEPSPQILDAFAELLAEVRDEGDTS